MKLLFDENLSRKLVPRLADLYPYSAHVAELDLLHRPDSEVWEFARSADWVVVTADADFYELSTTFGPPPKVVWLRRWTYTTRDAERILRREAIRVADFVADADLGILILDWTPAP